MSGVGTPIVREQFIDVFYQNDEGDGSQNKGVDLYRINELTTFSVDITRVGRAISGI